MSPRAEPPRRDPDGELAAAKLWAHRREDGSGGVAILGIAALFVTVVVIAAYMTANWNVPEPKYVPQIVTQTAPPPAPAPLTPAEESPVAAGEAPASRSGSVAPARPAAPPRATAAVPGARPAQPAKAAPALPASVPEQGRAEWKELWSRPAEYLVAHTWFGSGGKLSRMARNPEAIGRYLDRPLVRAVLGSPMLINWLAGSRPIAKALLNTPAMRDPKAVRDLFGSPLMTKVLSSPGVKALMNDPIKMAQVLGHEDVAEWLRKNPAAMSAITKSKTPVSRR